jgi:hypothetical protein
MAYAFDNVNNAAKGAEGGAEQAGLAAGAWGAIGDGALQGGQNGGLNAEAQSLSAQGFPSPSLDMGQNDATQTSGSSDASYANSSPPPGSDGG